MHRLTQTPPLSPKEDVTDILHGVAVTDSYRWLEDQESPQTRRWIEAQTHYARSYLDAIPGRERIRERVRELLDVETYDFIQNTGSRYIFRKRLAGQEQPSIFLREGPDGPDQLLVDPAARGTGKYTAVRPLRVSPDGRLLLYEIKEGGERSGAFELLDIESRETLPDALPRGYLRGFAFAPDAGSFYYVHESVEECRGAIQPRANAVHRHVFGTRFTDDLEIFTAAGNEHQRLHIVPGTKQLGFLVVRFLQKTVTDFYVWHFSEANAVEPVIRGAEYRFGPMLLKDGRILAITDCGAPNSRIIEVRRGHGFVPEFTDVVAHSDSPIQNWAVCGNHVFVSYLRELRTEIDIFDLFGKRLGQVPANPRNTVHMLGGSESGEHLFFEEQSFTQPIRISSYSTATSAVSLWAARNLPFQPERFDHIQTWYPGKDGTSIPMFLVGRRDILDGGASPTIMTSYGGYGIPMTPQFSVLVAFLMERGCRFALPQVRGGSELGIEWHRAAKRRNRQVAFDDFLAAAEWMIATGRTEPKKLAIFGGSNSGLLVGAAMTQRPELFCAVLCMVPLLDMLRYHEFDHAHVWRDELGTSDDAEDFAALLRYSPYHNLRDGEFYPATMIVAGDRDQNCNAMHARKMTARLQSANAGSNPILLDYSRERGHSPVLPLSVRIEALTNRLAFLCDRLELKA